jgi:hypothetical protein
VLVSAAAVAAGAGAPVTLVPGGSPVVSVHGVAPVRPALLAAALALVPW